MDLATRGCHWCWFFQVFKVSYALQCFGFFFDKLPTPQGGWPRAPMGSLSEKQSKEFSSTSLELLFRSFSGSLFTTTYLNCQIAPISWAKDVSGTVCSHQLMIETYYQLTSLLRVYRLCSLEACVIKLAKFRTQFEIYRT